MNASILDGVSWPSWADGETGLLEWHEEGYKLDGPLATVPRPYDGQL